MALREKYIGAHPFPPQDQPKFFSHHSGGPEDVGLGGPEDAGQSYRRRPIPPYDIFGEPIPARPKHTLHYQFQMVRGVMLLLPDPADESGRQPMWDDLTLTDSAFPVLSFKDYVEDYHFVRPRPNPTPAVLLSETEHNTVCLFVCLSFVCVFVCV